MRKSGDVYRTPETPSVGPKPSWWTSDRLVTALVLSIVGFFAVGLIFATVHDNLEMDNSRARKIYFQTRAPCSELKNWRVMDLPARCVPHFAEEPHEQDRPGP